MLVTGKRGIMVSGASSQNLRRRGQLSLELRLDAIKVDPAVYENLLQPKRAFPNTELQSTPLTKSKPFTPMLPSFVEDLTTDSVPPKRGSTSPSWSVEPLPACSEEQQPEPIVTPEIPSVTTVPEKSVGCFHKLFCFFHPLRKRKSRKRRRASTVVPQPVSTSPCAVNAENINPVRHQVMPTDGAGDGPTLPKSDRLTEAKLALLDTKSVEFCQAVLNSSLPLHDAIVKYFEQSSGVLVLDCTMNSPTGTTMGRLINAGTVLCVTVVATRPDLVTRLVDACQLFQNLSPEQSQVDRSDPVCGSRLSTDLQKVLQEANIRSVLNVQDFRLSVSLDSSEVNRALEELADLVE
ncbi:unnamed protein product [Echinostoma caproni]|uniref:Uncharacterized protein n=1 Tax=Echinostoma caproni TaxID=27848 RepID=A0A183B8Y1_9TREM|nr:unnamed protein product [Echinostoma caproni]